MVKTCGNCVYAKICKKAVGSWFSPKNIVYCEAYKDRTNYVEVVRCKDCKYYEPYLMDGYMCTKFLGVTIPKPDDFCSYGERREGE